MSAKHQKAYKERHPDRVKKSTKAWSQKNILKLRIASRERVRKTILQQQKRYYDKTKEADNSGERWTLKEETLVFSNITDRELSELIGRSMRAINVKRAKLKAAGRAPDGFNSKATRRIETPNA